MTTSVWLKAAALWFAILVLAILNGTLREEVLIPKYGNFAGLFSSGILLSVCILLVALITTAWYGRLTSRQWLLVGLFWLVLTMIFEFSFGRVVQQKTWTELFDAYTFQGGNIWPLVLVASCISPWLAAKIRGFIKND